MEFLEELFSNEWIVRIIYSILTILISYVVYKIIISIFLRHVDNRKIKLVSDKKSKTFSKLVKSIVKYIFIIMTVLIVLQINGINISSMIAGVGILSIIIGFAVQDALKDIVKGFDILFDSYYEVGDIIEFENITGKVLAIGLKTTKVEDIYTSNIVSIANRNIEKVQVVSDLINIDIPFPYEIELEKAENVINEIVGEIKIDKDVNKCEYRGVNDLADSSINYQIKVYCEPIKKLQVRRDSLRKVLVIFEKNNIQVPYNQIDVHQK